jgi:hypothetical protein
MIKDISAVWLGLFVLCFSAKAQVVINEGSNKNYSTLADEEGEFPDWIELYNAGTSAVNLEGYALSDDPDDPSKWILPGMTLGAGQFAVFYCSGKDRYATSPMTSVVDITDYTPVPGWNMHNFSSPYVWDGSSNLVVNVCSYSNTGYTTNSVHRQTATPFISTQLTFIDGSDAACFDPSGILAAQRPNLRLNGAVIGTGAITNSPFDYPAPYGNWYWSARHQMLIRASELTASGLSAGNIYTLGFDVESTDPTLYSNLTIQIGSVVDESLTGVFYPVGGFRNHTNFKIDGAGESVYLFSPAGDLLSTLDVHAGDLPDVSVGSFPDAAASVQQFYPPTPGASNNGSTPFSEQVLAPVFSVEGGLFTSPFMASISDPNTPPATIYYTLDGSNPDESSTLWTGAPLSIPSSRVLRAKAFSAGKLPSVITSASYLLYIDHQTPVLSVIADPENLYGETGMFDHPAEDWLKDAHVEYFDSTETHTRIFSQRAGMIMDGGYGGSRWQPQRSFRVKLADGVLGEGPIEHRVIPDRPTRTRYSDFYLRNGSNQYLVLPYKDASQVKMMGKGTRNYYSAWRPISVYINGSYFGLYELREKFNTEMFQEQDGADPGTVELLSLSAFYNYRLRAVEGSVQSFYDSYAALGLLNPLDTAFWTLADQHVDIAWYQDYVIAESWMGNVDWPYNNIKIYRSDATGNRWRYCVIDLELALAPNSWTDCYFDHIDFLQNQDINNPYINLWLRGMQNDRFHDYFINRFADQLNSVYLPERLLAMEQAVFEQTVIEMDNQYARWGDPFSVPEQMTAFYNNHLLFQSELACRGTQVRQDIQTNFGLPGQVYVTLNTEPEDAGTVRISTLEPEEYPWSGIYFNGVPIGVEAIAKPGFTFSHWHANDVLTDTLNPRFLDTLNLGGAEFTAVFEEIPSGLGPAMAAHSFKVYPSPAQDKLWLEWQKNNAQPFLWEVMDGYGRLVLSGVWMDSAGSMTIPLGSLSSGLYWVRVATSNGVYTVQSFIKA